eukprot:4097131-Pleurochrysis_carterae.AAC.2
MTPEVQHREEGEERRWAGAEIAVVADARGRARACVRTRVRACVRARLSACARARAFASFFQLAPLSVSARSLSSVKEWTLTKKTPLSRPMRQKGSNGANSKRACETSSLTMSKEPSDSAPRA